MFFPSAFKLTYKEKDKQKSDLIYVINNEVMKSWAPEYEEDPLKYFFRNNYLNENEILINDILFLNDTGLFRSSNEKEFNDGYTEKQCSISYESENGKESFTLELKYYVNKELIAEVPNFVFRNIFRVAVFTKRNQLALADTLKHALRSAISAIMGRNMSHNLGSHVLATVATQLKYFNLKDDQLLFKYLQHRMDFISLISTDFPRWTTPAWFIQEIMRELYSQRHLLHYLGISEGITAYEHNGKEHGKLKILICVNNHPVEDFSRDFQIAVPGGLIGHHAFYVILEGIIRNAAKHGYSKLDEEDKPTKNLEITIDIKNNLQSDIVTCTIYDNISDCGRGQKLNENDAENDLGDEHIPEGNLPLHWIINRKLKKGLLSDKTLRKEDWGIGELKICAGFLQKIELNKIGREHEDNLKILKAVAKKDRDGNYHLGYRLTLHKPKEILIVARDSPVSGFKEGIYREAQLPKECDFEFCVLVDSDGFEIEPLKSLKKLEQLNATARRKLENKLETLPARLFVVSEDRSIIKINNGLSLEKRIVLLSKRDLDIICGNAEEIKSKLFKRWVEHLKNSHGIKSKLSLVINPGAVKDTTEIEYSDNNLRDIAENHKKELGLFKYRPKTLPGYYPNSEEKTDNLWKSFTLEGINFSDDKDYNGNTVIRYARHKSPEITSDLLYGENLSGNAIHFPLFSNPTESLAYLCLENGLVRIGICDERVAQANVMTSGSGAFVQALSLANLFVINKFGGYWHQIISIAPKSPKEQSIDDGEQWVSSLGLEGKYELKDFSSFDVNPKPNTISLDVLIIHQGVLDKAFEQEKNTNKKEFFSEKVKTLKQTIPHIIVTSGRGVPVDLPDNAKFLPFSVIEAFVLSKPHHKFLLTQTVLNLIKTHEK